MTTPGAALAVSLLAAPDPSPRALLETAARAAALSLRLHVDVIDAADGRGTGIDPGLLPELCRLGPVEVHVMGVAPAALVEALLDAGPDTLLVHTGSGPLTAAARDRGVALWTAVGPDRPLPAPDADGLLLVAIPPGSRTARFDPATVGRVAGARAAGWTEIGVDGGVGPAEAAAVVAAGATRVVSGRSLFTGDLATRVQELRRRCTPGTGTVDERGAG
ncbi:hypothetical protein [Nakamurella endophytica]|uniref:hypothetical protein n=1 Tax=Nakamurella endophytica TaxID=1748367 RepID=UPI00166BD2E4|nr:hypothetical protein [Nakamurella endophytica]